MAMGQKCILLLMMLPYILWRVCRDISRERLPHYRSVGFCTSAILCYHRSYNRWLSYSIAAALFFVHFVEWKIVLHKQSCASPHLSWTYAESVNMTAEFWTNIAQFSLFTYSIQRYCISKHIIQHLNNPKIYILNVHNYLFQQIPWMS